MTTNGYPFLSRKQVLERIASDPAFVVECVAILQDRYARRAALAGEAAGWTASHVSRAIALAAKLASGGASEKERTEAAKLASGYTKQLARVYRERELAARPELAGQAAVFGIGPASTSPRTAPETPHAASPVAPGTATAPDVPPAPRKRRAGRPKGSKNKHKTTGETGGRRKRT